MMDVLSWLEEAIRHTDEIVIAVGRRHGADHVSLEQYSVNGKETGNSITLYGDYIYRVIEEVKNKEVWIYHKTGANEQKFYARIGSKFHIRLASELKRPYLVANFLSGHAESKLRGFARGELGLTEYKIERVLPTHDREGRND